MARFFGCGLFVWATCLGQAIGAAPPGSREIGEYVGVLSRDEALNLLVERDNSGPYSERTRLEREVELNRKAMQVEIAYWNLYGSWWALAGREQGLYFAHETLRIVQERYRVGQASEADVMLCRAQYEQVHNQRLKVLVEIEESERHLRNLLGLKKDRWQLVPSDAPDVAAFTPNWDASLTEALTHRPEIILLRQGVETARNLLILAKSFHEFRSTWPYLARVLVSLFERPAIAPPENPIRLWGSPKIVWNTEKRIKQHGIIGCMAERFLAFQMERLKDQELKTQSYLGRQYEQSIEAQTLLNDSLAQSRTFAEQVQARRREFLAGICTLDVLLKAQQLCTDSLVRNAGAAVEFVKYRCAYAYAKGAILKERDRIAAVEGEAQQTKGMVRSVENLSGADLRSRPMPIHCLAIRSLPVLWINAPPLHGVEPLSTGK